MSDLEALKGEIERYLDQEGFAIFRGFPRVLDSTPLVYWDCDHYPDYKAFLQNAKAAGAPLIVYHQHEFSSDEVDDAIGSLDLCEFSVEERRAIERRLKDMRAYDGFVCALELSFDHQGRVYVFDLHTEWYDELQEILEDIQVISSPDEDDDDDHESPMGGYFSKN